MSHDHSHGHGHDHDHEHTHNHSHGHQVPWDVADEKWFVPGWNDPIVRTIFHAAELNTIDVVVDADCLDINPLSAAAGWAHGPLTGIVPASVADAIRAALSGHPNAERFRIQSHAPPAGEASIVWSIGAASKWSEPAARIAAMHAMLRPGGQIFVADDGLDARALRGLLREQGFRGVQARNYTLEGVRFVLLMGRRAAG